MCASFDIALTGRVSIARSKSIYWIDWKCEPPIRSGRFDCRFIYQAYISLAFTRNNVEKKKDVGKLKTMGANNLNNLETLKP